MRSALASSSRTSAASDVATAQQSHPHDVRHPAILADGSTRPGPISARSARRRAAPGRPTVPISSRRPRTARIVTSRRDRALSSAAARSPGPSTPARSTMVRSGDVTGRPPTHCTSAAADPPDPVNGDARRPRRARHRHDQLGPPEGHAADPPDRGRTGVRERALAARPTRPPPSATARPTSGVAACRYTRGKDALPHLRRVPGGRSEPS